jgi:hypothetical protein
VGFDKLNQRGYQLNRRGFDKLNRRGLCCLNLVLGMAKGGLAGWTMPAKPPEELRCAS